MLAIDIAVFVLGAGVAVLCVTTAITALSLPSFNPSWRRRTRSMPTMNPITIAYERPSQRRALALPPGRYERPIDVDSSTGDVDEAWDLIEHLLERDPGRLAGVLQQWIAGDLAAESETDHSNEPGQTRS